MVGLIVLALALAVVIVVFFTLVLPGFALVRDSQVGFLTKRLGGAKMPEGQIIAHKGEIGVQALTLMPGLYWRFPLVWKITKGSITVIGPDQIGIVESVDGNPLQPHRLLGDEVTCNSFQDAKMFLESGGTKGPQVGILRPGTYRINTKVFNITLKPVTTIEKDHVGVVVALDGRPLPNGYIIAPSPEKGKDHQFFQIGQAFIDSGGYRGPQLDTLQPGQYYINPLLFKVEVYPVAEVAPGYVAILRSNVGIELASERKVPVPAGGIAMLNQPVHEEAERLLIPAKDRRGIWSEPIAPGKYNLNPIAFTPYLVPTSAVTIDWARGTEIRTDLILDDRQDSGIKRRTSTDKPAAIDRDSRPESIKASEFFKFSQLRVTSKDGFQLEVDVRMVIRIRPENAAFIIARFGSVNNLIEQIVHPLIDSSFRNKAGEEKAMAFIQGRTQLQKDALERARDEFNKYNVEAQNLLIAYIDVDKALLDTQTNKEIAIQQQEQYREQAKAQEENIAVKEKEARAAKQSDVIAARLSVDINANNASAAIKKAEGERESVKILADGNAYSIKAIAEGNAYKSRIEGEGIAQAYKAQTDVIGSTNVFLTKLMETISEGNVQITPQIVAGSDGNNVSGLLNALLARSLLPEIKPKAQE